jgi:hypothetical protein
MSVPVPNEGFSRGALLQLLNLMTLLIIGLKKICVPLYSYNICLYLSWIYIKKDVYYTTSANSGTGTTYPSGSPEFTPDF